MVTPIRKAVFPVAGMGTRFLPATKANPKEMLPIVDKPLIQYAVEEAIQAGVNELIFVTSSSKRAIEDHFDSNFELETKLKQRGKLDVLEIVQNVLPKGVSCTYVRQHEALGLGHAILCARQVVGDEPFAILLADDLLDDGDKLCLAQMVDEYEKVASSIIAVESIAPEHTDKYGIVSLQQKTPPLHLMAGIVEKPKPQQAPSNLAAVGRYILTPRIFDLLANTKPGSGGEIQLTDAIARLLQEEKVYALEFHGKRYDCGSRVGYLEATVEFALKHPEIGERFRKKLVEILR